MLLSQGWSPMDMPARILVADDDKFVHAVFGDLLTGAGYTVLPAWDGEEALTVARAEHPDVILLAILMPKRNGIQVAQDLKTDAATRHIPIVIVSTLADALAAQISRADVAGQLQSLGLTPQAAKDRVAALTDVEVAKLAGQIDSLPAGADGTGVVLLILLGVLIWWVVKK